MKNFILVLHVAKKYTFFKGKGHCQVLPLHVQVREFVENRNPGHIFGLAQHLIGLLNKYHIYTVIIC